MMINLSDPFWSTLIGGLLVFVISIGIAGIIKFSIIAHQKKLIEDSFFRLRSELESIQKVYQDEITKNNEQLTAVTKEKTAAQNLLSEIHNDIKEILKHNQPPLPKPKTFKELYFSQAIPKKKDDP